MARNHVESEPLLQERLRAFVGQNDLILGDVGDGSTLRKPSRHPLSDRLSRQTDNQTLASVLPEFGQGDKTGEVFLG